MATAFEFGPFRLDHLGGDTHPASILADAALHQITHAQFATDPLHVDGRSLVGEPRMAGDDEQPFDAGQSGNDVLDHAVGKILLLHVAAQIGERQHRHGWFAGQSQR